MLELQQWRRENVLAAPALRRTASWGQGRAPGDAGVKVAKAWQSLSVQPGLPPALTSQARRIAEHWLPVLDEARRQLLQD